MSDTSTTFTTIPFIKGQKWLHWFLDGLDRLSEPQPIDYRILEYRDVGYNATDVWTVRIESLPRTPQLMAYKVVSRGYASFKVPYFSDYRLDYKIGEVTEARPETIGIHCYRRIEAAKEFAAQYTKWGLILCVELFEEDLSTILVPHIPIPENVQRYYEGKYPYRVTMVPLDSDMILAGKVRPTARIDW